MKTAPDPSTPRPSLPPIIAVVGCDGSGKSTVTGLLGAWLAASQPTAVCHLGKQSGNVGRAIARLPLVGPKLRHEISKKSKTVRAEHGPNLMIAMLTYAFSIRQVLRFRRMMKLHRAGYLILTDRYPQIELPGAIDGPRLGKARKTGLIGWLVRSELRMFGAMVAHLPNLMIRLNVSPEIAQARKPDHRPAALVRKIGELSHLRFQGAPITEINADEPLEVVVAKTKAAITELLKTMHAVPPGAAPARQ